MEKQSNRYWDTGKCLKCGGEIKKETYKENRGDMMFIPLYEEINVFSCPHCGWSDLE